MRPHGRARVSARHPQAFGICDRCNFTYNLSDLRWEFQWAGPALRNMRLRVCSRCEDEPQQQLRSIILAPDPVPVSDPRPSAFTLQSKNYISTQSGLSVITQGSGSFSSAFSSAFSLVSNSGLNLVMQDGA